MLRFSASREHRQGQRMGEAGLHPSKAVPRRVAGRALRLQRLDAREGARTTGPGAQCAMTQVDYTRCAGKKLTYRIQADSWGWFEVWLGGALLMKGHDRLAAHGVHRKPSRRKEAGAVAAACVAIETLREMSEE